MAKYSESIEKQHRTVGDLKVNVDVSEALKGLKTVERQAKKTARALKEVETQQVKMDLGKYSEQELLDEMTNRGWEVLQHGLADFHGVPIEKLITMKKSKY